MDTLRDVEKIKEALDINGKHSSKLSEQQSNELMNFLPPSHEFMFLLFLDKRF